MSLRPHRKKERLDNEHSSVPPHQARRRHGHIPCPQYRHSDHVHRRSQER